jgi:hypothetical protein
VNLTIESVHVFNADPAGRNTPCRNAIANAFQRQTQHVETYGDIAN